VVDKAYYRRLWEQAETVEIHFTPYDQDPLGANGAAISVQGEYTLAVGPRPIIVYHELSTGLADDASGFNAVNFLTPQWWVDGSWSDIEPATPATTRLIVNDSVLNSYTNTIGLTALGWDGSPDNVRSVEAAVGSLAAGPANSPMKVLAKVMTDRGILLVDQATDAKFTGWYPQLQGTLTDVLKQVSSGLGVFIAVQPYTGVSGGLLGTVYSKAPAVRLINPVYPERHIVEPSYVPTVRAALYESQRVTKSVIYQSSDVIQVTPYQDQTIHFPIAGTPFINGIIQPTAVPAIPTIPYNGPASPYCVVDSADFEASNRWTQLGGKITVTMGDNPDEIIVNITAPGDDSGETYFLSEGDSHPAFYISANDGVKWNQRDVEMGTGAVVPSATYRPSADIPYLDNEVVINKALLYDRLNALAHTQAWPTLTLDSVSFDAAVLQVNMQDGAPADPVTLANAVFRTAEAYWRFVECSWNSVDQTWSGSAIWHTTQGDYANEWGNMTLAQYQAYLVAEYGATPTIAQVFYEPLRRSTNA
jgi:hypothetical protein